MPTTKDLGQLTKQKYPGIYDDMSDFDVGRKVKERYPEYRDFVDNRSLAEDFGNVIVGGLKGLGSTVFGGLSLAQDIGKLAPIRALGGGREIDVIPERKPEFLQPSTEIQRKAFIVEQIVEFLLPASKISKVEKALTSTTKVKTAGALTRFGIQESTKKSGFISSAFSTFTKSLTEGLTVGGQRALQKGEIDNEVKTVALVASAFPFLTVPLGSLLKGAGEKVQQTVIRPNSQDLKEGFNIINVTKYKVGGSLPETVAKTHVLLNRLSRQLENELKNIRTSVNLNNAVKETENQLLGVSKAKSFGDVSAIRRVLENQLKIEVKEQAGENGLVDLLEATYIKRGAGTKGAWAFNRVEPDASAIERVYSTFYTKLRVAIEEAAGSAGPKIHNINKQIGEVIPISNAALRRLPVEQRNNVLGLTDSIGLFASVFDPRALSLVGATRLSRSGRFGSFLVRVGEALKTGRIIPNFPGT